MHACTVYCILYVLCVAYVCDTCRPIRVHTFRLLYASPCSGLMYVWCMDIDVHELSPVCTSSHNYTHRLEDRDRKSSGCSLTVHWHRKYNCTRRTPWWRVGIRGHPFMTSTKNWIFGPSPCPHASTWVRPPSPLLESGRPHKVGRKYTSLYWND